MMLGAVLGLGGLAATLTFGVLVARALVGQLDRMVKRVPSAMGVTEHLSARVSSSCPTSVTGSPDLPVP